MARKVLEWKTKSGRKGFVQEEGILSIELVIYEKKGFFGFGTEKLGELSPELKGDELLRELEVIIGERVEISTF
jgi:hypothetical protein